MINGVCPLLIFPDPSFGDIDDASLVPELVTTLIL